MYKTTDVNFAAVLVSLGFSTPEIDTDTNPVKATFIFEDNGSIEEHESDYRSGKVLLDPKSLFKNFWDLKNSLWEIKKSR